MESSLTCYKCGRPATTREHTPPLCLFPEAKDFRGLNFRKDLITVPSCEDHNSKKSHDDEFLMIALAGVVGNNLLGFVHSMTKVNRALKRKSESFLTERVVRSAKHYEVKAPGGRNYYLIKGIPDYDRFIKCFEHIAAGLFFHEYGYVFSGITRILLGFVEYNDGKNNTLISLLKHKMEVDEPKANIKGNNPEVFTYQFCAPDKHGIIGLRMTFYEGAEIYVAYQPTGKDVPFDLGFYLMNRGIHTTFEIGGKKFEFNKD